MNKAIIISGNLVQDHEFIYPYYRLLEEGFKVDVCLLEGKPVQGILGTKIPPNKDQAVKKIDEISVNDSLIECYLLSPVNPKNKELQIWINSVFPYTPIKIAKRIKQGILTMHLDSLIYEK